MNEMLQEGQRVQVRLYGDETGNWYTGTVVKPRKKWVELDDTYPGGQFVADEGFIVDWRPAPTDSSPT